MTCTRRRKPCACCRRRRSSNECARRRSLFLDPIWICRRQPSLAIHSLCRGRRLADAAAPEEPRSHTLLALAGGFTQVSAPVRTAGYCRISPALEAGARSAISSLPCHGPDHPALCPCGSAACAGNCFSCRSGTGDAHAAFCRVNGLVYWIWSAVDLLVCTLASHHSGHPPVQVSWVRQGTRVAARS